MGNTSDKETSNDDVEVTAEEIEEYVREQKILEQKKAYEYYTQLLINAGCNFYEHMISNKNDFFN
jgi:hypothetical protein